MPKGGRFAFDRMMTLKAVKACCLCRRFACCSGKKSISHPVSKRGRDGNQRRSSGIVGERYRILGLHKWVDPFEREGGEGRLI